LQRREALNYPPFSHLIRVVCSAEHSADARTAATAVRERFAAQEAQPSASGAAGATVLGPASLFRLRGREREVLVIKAPQRRGAVYAVGEAVREVAATRTHRGVNFSVDVDPQ
ncbi:MAG: hypothetical protein ACYDHT_11930, partial [Solirubrobacteraceae bacterium]